jgi:hypothetical protein
MEETGSGWLTSLVLGAASVLAEEEAKKMASFAKIGVVSGTKGNYEIFGIKTEGGSKPIVQTNVFRLYPSKLPSGQLGLMKIAVAKEQNLILDREARLLNSLQREADEIDQEADEKGETKPFYGAMFPNVVEKINAEGRTALFLGFDDSISSYKQLMPLSLQTKSNRVDLQTTVWIFGKLLKLLDFIHRQGYALGSMNAGNILLETSLHGVIVLDFSNAIKSSMTELEVSTAAKVIWEAAGDIEDPLEYSVFLKRAMSGARSANLVYKDLYDLSDQIWPKVPTVDGKGLKRQFHEFCIYPRSDSEINKEVL